ncbi:nucleotide-binding universal stress UspA family protein [Kribbella aluminosa]|uniref:Nucleotide-binding universal stress UspA family protein n=1 Tax=Kribbella aluminosa TaxID=416017 RepID=A0ABS4ULR0_9ACTN|nr:universal stress protein [Kribbella aluminosa]MBP2352596.1 nucleotide-binding universal stress UspA family protein [Kribbella aluminosa]
MSTWTRTGPVVVEVDGRAENLRVVDYAAAEALRRGAELVLVAPYSAHSSFSPMTLGYTPKPPAELADATLRAAAAHVRHRDGYALQLAAVAGEGSRTRVLAHAARNARMLIVGRSRGRGPQQLLNTHTNLTLASRAGCPVVVVPASWKPSLQDRKVAVGIDGTALSSEALEFAFGTAAGREAELVVVHAGLPAEHAWNDDDPEHTWISRADHLLSETLAPWASRFPEVRVTRFLSSRQPAAALVQESGDVGLVVVGSHGSPLPIDPVARRSVAAMTCPVAIVPHHRPTVEHELQQCGDHVVPTS